MENSRRIQAVLDNLDITFINCKFIYAQLDFKNGPNSGRRKSTIQKIIKEAEKTLGELSGRQRYEGCTFFPGDEEDITKQISTYETDTMKFKFVQCNFIRRNSSFLENLVRKLRRIFGISFELNYVTGAAEIEGRKFKIKDIPGIVTHVVERIQED